MRFHRQETAGGRGCLQFLIVRVGAQLALGRGGRGRGLGRRGRRRRVVGIDRPVEPAVDGESWQLEGKDFANLSIHTEIVTTMLISIDILFPHEDGRDTD